MLHPRSALLIILASAMPLSGCHVAKALIPSALTTTVPDSDAVLKLAKQKLAQATPCCSSLADFSYQTSLPWHPQEFTLGNDSLVANLNGDKSYFLAFALPVGAKFPYRIAFKSSLNGRRINSSYVFAPSVVLLDDGFQSITSEDIGLCEHMGWSDETTGVFGSYTVKDKRARYLLVYSSTAQQSGKTYWEQSPATDVATSTTTPLSMNQSGNFSIPHGPDGALWVGIIDKAYAKAIDNAVCQKPVPGNGVINSLRTELPLPWNTGSGDAPTANNADTSSKSP